MSIRAALILAVLVFVATLLARWPARLLAALLPAAVHCQSPSGTVWQGSCAQLRSGRLVLDDVSWNVHPAALLRLSLSADVRSEDPRAAGRARIDWARGVLRIRALSAQLPLAGGLALFPPGLAGTLQLAIDSARLRHGELVGLQGSVRALQLRSPLLAAGDLGSFELRFEPAPAGQPIAGQLRDLGGPLSVSGALRLLPGGGYKLSGWVTPRGQTSPQLLQALQLLGPADAQGRRAFSLAGQL